ncbi:hypothetical protein HO415_02175 [Streptococcus suis]|nr:hypothetical protein [Streptococcus suis]
MIYLKDGNIPLNLAYDDDIVQEANSTYQLSFKFPLTDGKWNLLKREVFLLADDLHGEQEFFIFEVKKAKGHVQVYAKQVATLLNYYSINSISVDRVPGQTVMTALAGSVKRPCPFSFFSDILDRHTFNESNVSVMDALTKDKHSIVGQWGGDLVRDKYQVKLLKNGGIENESLFMYKKNLSSYEESENINNLKTRLHLKKTIQGQSEGEADRVIAVTVDSPLIGQYRHIYEADIEVNDQDVTDVASLTAYGKRYFSSTLCDLVENSINLDVKGKSDVSVKMFDTVSVFHEQFDVDLRLKITSYHFGPMSKRLKSIGFGKVSQTFGSTVASMVAGSVDKATNTLSASFEQKLQKEIDNANRHFDAEFDKRVEGINDGIEQAQAEAERYADNIKRSIDTEIAQVNTSMQAQSQEHDRQVADILSKTQSVESLANQAKSDAASAIARANQVKTEAIADARAQVATVSQALNTAKSELQTAIASADQKARDSQASATALRNDLNLQASKILEQAQAQTALTSRVSTVETLADGTRSTVAELSKTVSKATGDIASVSSRTKTVEDTLSQTRTQYEALTQTVNTQTGQIDSINRKTADLQSGIDGVTERFENLRVGARNYAEDYDFKRGMWEYSQGDDSAKNWNISDGIYTLTTTTNTFHQYQIHSESGSRLGGKKDSTALLELEVGETYTLSVEVKANSGSPKFWLELRDNGLSNYNWVVTHLGGSRNVISATSEWVRYSVTGTIKPNSGFGHRRIILGYNEIGSISFRKVELSRGTKPMDTGPAVEDNEGRVETLRSELGTYIRNATENSAELARRIETADGKAVEAKTYAQQTATVIKTRLESLETYKDAEGTRASQYLSASRTETAKQLSAERAAIASNYVAKSTYDENVRGTTLKLNEIKSTADTTKQNLATYQNTVDGKLEELISSTQTLDGKINTASAKVDTVAGQIRTEISEVEGKIPREYGGRNYLRNSRKIIRSQQRFIEVLTWEVLAGLVGKTVTFSFDIKINPGGVSRPILVYRYQNNGISPALSSTVTPTSEWQRFSLSGIVKSDIVNSTYTKGGIGFYDLAGNNDYSIQLLKIELGTIATDWTPAPEDFENELSSVKTTITQTASGVEQLSTSLSTTNSKVTTAETKINQLIGDVSSKVSQTDYNTLTGRVSSAETTITQNATEISKRLTSTQVESAITGKGYQTKSQVDNNITGRGYITNSALQPYALSTTVQNLVKETAGSFERQITETRGLIPSEVNQNLFDVVFSDLRATGGASFVQSDDGWIEVTIKNRWSGFHWFYSDNINPSKKQYVVSYEAYLVDTVAETARLESDFGSPDQLTLINKTPKRYTVVLNRPVNIFNYINFVCDSSETGKKFRIRNIKLEEGIVATPYIAPFPTTVLFNAVKDTVDAHKRLIGNGDSISQAIQSANKFERSISSGGDIYQAIETAKGLVTEVSGANGLKTQVSTLAGSYAVKNLNSSGDILSQANLSSAQFLLEAAKIRLKGKTLADEIQAIDGKFGTLFVADGTFAKLNATVIGSQAITADKLKVDQAFFDKLMANDAYLRQLFAKSAFITQVQAVTLSASKISGGILTATNGAMKVNLNAGQILYYTDQAALKRVLNGYPTQFVKFATGTVAGKGTAGVTVIGSNRRDSESSNDGGFVGIRAWNGSNIDQIDVVGDTVRLASSTFESADGWTVNTLPGKLDIDAFNADHRASSKIKVGDLWLWKNATTYSSMRDTINLIIDNLQLLHNNKSTERGYSYTLPAKV